jgi:hypothetical protein
LQHLSSDIDGDAANHEDGDERTAHVKLDRGKLEAAFLKLEHLAADNEYFRSSIVNGMMKYCPQCHRLIEKMEGCDSMVCGDDAHGVRLYINTSTK